MNRGGEVGWRRRRMEGEGEGGGCRMDGDDDGGGTGWKNVWRRTMEEEKEAGVSGLRMRRIEEVDRGAG